jgi:hypothetical protein
MTDSEIFNEAMGPYGGEIAIESYSNSKLNNFGFVRVLADNWIKSCRKFIPRLPEIYFGFINNSTPNAVAFTSDNRGFIGVFAGTAYIFQTIFSRMLSDRRILPQIGDIWQESDKEQSLIGLTECANETFRTGIKPTQPRCEIRSLYCERLFEDVFTFLIKHEITHIANGHAGYLNREQENVHLFEIGDKDDSESDALMKQTFEMDADAQACINFINNARFQHILETPPHTIEQSLFRRAFALFSFFRMFGDSKFLNENLFDDHPHDRMREMLCLVNILLVIDNWPIEERERSRRAIGNARLEVESAFSFLNGEPFLMIDGLLEANGMTGKEYDNKLRHYFCNVTKPLIQPYAYFDLDRPIGVNHYHVLT